MIDLDEAVAFAKAFRHLAKEPYVRVAHPGLKDGLIGIDPKALEEIADLGTTLVAELRAARLSVDFARDTAHVFVGSLHGDKAAAVVAAYDKVSGGK